MLVSNYLFEYIRKIRIWPTEKPCHGHNVTITAQAVCQPIYSHRAREPVYLNIR